MIYTVGLVNIYEPRIDAGTAVKGGPGLDERGQRYSGGWVWRTAGEAQAYLAARNSENSRRVYGLEAEWETDTAEVSGQPTRCLTREARVVRIP